MINKKNRIISFLVILVFSFVILSSALFIIFNADHKCCGNDCYICLELAECYDSLLTHGNVTSGKTYILLLLISIIVSVRVSISAYSKHNTLISLKVELLN